MKMLIIYFFPSETKNSEFHVKLLCIYSKWVQIIQKKYYMRKWITINWLKQLDWLDGSSGDGVPSAADALPSNEKELEVMPEGKSWSTTRCV